MTILYSVHTVYEDMEPALHTNVVNGARLGNGITKPIIPRGQLLTINYGCSLSYTGILGGGGG